MSHHNVLSKNPGQHRSPIVNPQTPLHIVENTQKPTMNPVCTKQPSHIYLLCEEYLVTAFVPSETACLASSPGRMSLTEVWISRDEMVDFLL